MYWKYYLWLHHRLLLWSWDAKCDTVIGWVRFLECPQNTLWRSVCWLEQVSFMQLGVKAGFREKIENIYPWHLTSKPDHLFSHPGFFKQQRGCPNMLVTYVQGTVLYGKTLNYVQSYCFLEGVEPWVLTSVRTHLATLKGFAQREKKFTYKQRTNK